MLISGVLIGAEPQRARAWKRCEVYRIEAALLTKPAKAIAAAIQNTAPGRITTRLTADRMPGSFEANHVITPTAAHLRNSTAMSWAIPPNQSGMETTYKLAFMDNKATKPNVSQSL
jgi:hypothetical protein